MQTIDNRASSDEPFRSADAAGTPPHASGAEPWCQVVEHVDGFTMRFGGADPAVLRACLESFYGAVPPQRRRWNALTKTWWIDPAVERMLGSLSRWAGRSFAAHRVQRSSAPEATAPAWVSLPPGDDAAEGWILTADPRPKPAPHVAPRAPHARPAATAGWPWGQPPMGAASTPPKTPGPAGPAARVASDPPPKAAPLAQLDPVAESYAALWLRPGAPWPVVRAAYRALATVHHPDHGGDGAHMKDLNAAYALLRRRAEYASLPDSSPEPPAASRSAAPPHQDEDDEDDGFSL